MQKISKINQQKRGRPSTCLIYILSLIICTMTGCATQKPTTKMSGNLAKLPKNLLVAILPVQISDSKQKEAAELFRQSLYANFERSRFKLVERYIVDGLLEQNNIQSPNGIKKVSAIRLGEILGADAVLYPVMSKIERSYAVIHSSIELTASFTLTDTRTGEILWTTSQTETDFEGIGKIPTGIFAAAIAPAELVTNKLNLNKIIHKLTEKLTFLIEEPESAQEGEFFNSLQIAPDSAKEIEEIASSPIQLAPNQTSKFEINNEIKKSRSKLEPKVENPIFKAVKSFFYTVQVGAYKTKVYAKKMISTLAKKGYSAFITPSKKHKQVLYKVNVEKFDNKEKAGEFAEKFSMRENLDHFVTRVESKNPS
jgi:hypothetical protein